MRIQFPHPSDSTAESSETRANRASTPAPWQSIQRGDPRHPMTQKGVGKRLSNAPRRRAY